jgi:hypothetical protein
MDDEKNISALARDLVFRDSETPEQLPRSRGVLAEDAGRIVRGRGDPVGQGP